MRGFFISLNDDLFKARKKSHKKNNPSKLAKKPKGLRRSPGRGLNNAVKKPKGKMLVYL